MQCPALPGSPGGPALAHALLALLALASPGKPWLGRAPSSRPAKGSEMLLELFSSFSQASVAARPRTRGPASSQQSCSLKHPVPSYHDPDHFHVMSPFNPRPRFVRFSPCLPCSYGYYCLNHQTDALPSAPPAFYSQVQALLLRYLSRYFGTHSRYIGVDPADAASDVGGPLILRRLLYACRLNDRFFGTPRRDFFLSIRSGLAKEACSFLTSVSGHHSMSDHTSRYIRLAFVPRQETEVRMAG